MYDAVKSVKSIVYELLRRERIHRLRGQLSQAARYRVLAERIVDVMLGRETP